MKKEKVQIIEGVVLECDDNCEVCIPIQWYDKFLDTITDKKTGEEHWAADFYFKDIQWKIIWLCMEYGSGYYCEVDEHGEPTDPSRRELYWY